MLILALIFPFLSSLFYFKFFDQSNSIQALYSATKFLMFLLPFLFWRKGFFKHIYKFKTDGLVMGALFGILIFCGIILIYHFTPLGDFILGSKDAIYEKVTQVGLREHFVLYAIVISFIHSLLEEYYWRGFCFTWLKEKTSVNMAIIISSFAFGLHHFVILSEFFDWMITVLFGTAVVIGGIFWSYLIHRSKSIYGPWISHLFIDLAIFYVGYQILFV